MTPPESPNADPPIPEYGCTPARGVLLTVVVAGMLLVADGSAVAGEPSHRHGGLTSTGTVTDKAFTPEHQQWVTLNRQPYWVTLGDCWRLDLRRGPLTGWVCVDQDEWDRTPVGGHWAGAR